MDPASLALSVLAVVDLCIEYGCMLHEACQTYQHAEAQYEERLIEFRHRLMVLRHQLQVLNGIWGSLGSEFQDSQRFVLEILAQKLRKTRTKLEKLQKPQTENGGTETQVRRLKLVFRKADLDEALSDLAKWGGMFDPSWYLILRIPNPVIDSQLTTLLQHSQAPGSRVIRDAQIVRDTTRNSTTQTRHIFLSKNVLAMMPTHSIPYTSAIYTEKPKANGWYIVDSVPHNLESDVNLAKTDVKSLATKLSCEVPLSLGILQCKGVVQNSPSEPTGMVTFDFVFQAPPNFDSNVESLRGLLISQAEISLTTRFKLATQLARSVSYVHALGFVHKNVRPETVIVPGGSQGTSGALFLLGFQKFRLAEGKTWFTGDMAWERNLYRHPERQGLHLEGVYIMQHDIYSLGVCLLEIGLWQSLVEYEGRGTDPVPSPILGLKLNPDSPSDLKPLKNDLAAIARQRLPSRVGDEFTDVVVDCLTCLDKDNAHFGNPSEFEDEDGILVGVRYIQKILLRLENLTV